MLTHLLAMSCKRSSGRHTGPTVGIGLGRREDETSLAVMCLYQLHAGKLGEARGVSGVPRLVSISLQSSAWPNRASGVGDPLRAVALAVCVAVSTILLCQARCPGHLRRRWQDLSVDKPTVYFSFKFTVHCSSKHSGVGCAQDMRPRRHRSLAYMGLRLGAPNLYRNSMYPRPRW